MKLINYEIICIFFVLSIITIYVILDKLDTFHLKIGIMSISLIFISISSIRCNFGSDYFSYYRMYNYASDISLDILDSIENGFQFGMNSLIMLGRNISNSPYFLFLLVSVLVYPSMMLWLYKKSNNFKFSLLLFLLFGFFSITNNILKQSIALGLLLWSYEYFRNKKYVIFTILLIISSTFHISSLIVAILFMVAKRIKPTFNLLYISICIGLIITLGYKYITSTLISIFPIFNRFLHYTSGREFSLPFFITSLMYITILIYISIKLLKKVNCGDHNDRIVMIIISIPFAICSLEYVVTIRFCLFALMQATILIPYYFDLFQIKKGSIRISRLTIVIFLFFLISNISSGNNRYYTYETIFNSTPSSEWYR